MTQPKKLINGILLLDKPLYLTSNGALQRVKRLFGAKKAGHTGSLDPLATGMLPLCFGEATKVSQYLLESDKYYQAIVKFGEKTTTGDAEGEVIETRSIDHLTISMVQKTLGKLTGVIEQIPPMFSALKHKGKPLYKLARQGIEVERKPRQITIYQLVLCQDNKEECVFEQQDNSTFSFQSKPQSISSVATSTSQGVDACTLFVHCSKGTYIRTLVEDLGELLGCGAHLIGLRRTAVAPYQNCHMVTLQELEDTVEQQGQEALLHYLLPLETSLEHFPLVKLSASSVFYIRNGQAVMMPDFPWGGLVRLFSEQNEFIGIGEMFSDGRVVSRRLFNSSAAILESAQL